MPDHDAETTIRHKAMNEVFESAERLAALLEEQRKCIERIIAMLDK